MRGRLLLGGLARRDGARSVVASLCATAIATAIGVGATPAGASLNGHDTMIYAFGSATFRGSAQSLRLTRPVVAMANNVEGTGYWLVGEDGAVYSYNAHKYGGINGWPLRKPVVGITATPTGHGYWIVTQDGVVFPLGDAHGYGDVHTKRLSFPIRGLVAAPDAHGYWLFASNGSVFAFGTAKFFGSTSHVVLLAKIVSMAATPSGKGYWLAAANGSVFRFGDATSHGSLAYSRLPAAIAGMARSKTGNGYWLAARDGHVYTFGDAGRRGDAVGRLAPRHYIVQLAATTDGLGYRMLAREILADVALLNPGATGAAVQYLQNRLRALGYWVPGATGVYDSVTQQAVYAFQKYNKLARTGVVDSATQLEFRVATRPVPRSPSGSLIEIDKARQLLMIVHSGAAVWTFAISSGSDQTYWSEGALHTAHTPEGVFTIIRQVNGFDHGPLGVLYRPKYFTWQGHAVHGYSSVPPYPASHGCVRVSNTAMDWIWANNMLPIGLPVWVY
jgi:hypothetical protein